MVENQRVLVLDMHYRPHRIVSWERAICMMVDEKVDVVEEFDEVIRSPSISIRMPAVIRMRRKAKLKNYTVRFSRTNVMTRDAYQCQYCEGIFDAKDLNLDHVWPRSRGGKTCWENIVASCYDCNAKKGDQTPEEAGMKLVRQPRRPAWLPITTRRFNVRSMPEIWRPYLGLAA